MTKTCLHCQSNFDIAQSDLDFYTKISPSFVGQKFQIPSPTLCPDCRQRRRMSFRNERNLYKRICDASGKQIISIYRPDCGYKVYDQKIRWSDARNASDYAMDFDFGKSFTENFQSLKSAVPIPSMYNLQAENSEYCNCSSYQKDCYLTSAATYNEKCMYGAYINDCNTCYDVFMTFNCELCYMTIDCEKSYKLMYASNCRNCSESFFLTNCNDCSFCWNCEGLENQKYCIDNRVYEKEAYYEKISALQQKSWSITLEQWKQRKQKNTILFSENSSGHHIKNCKNSINCVDAMNLEDCKNCSWFFDAKECHDIYSWGQQSERCYECVAIGESNYSILFSSNISTNCNNILYSFHCTASSDCFGCIGMRNVQYCIFNKQYSKVDYEQMLTKIISYMIETGERGEFLHPSLSAFAYNESIAMEYYPLEIQNSQLKMQNGGVDFDGSLYGYKRSTYEAPKPVSDKVIQGKDLPENIESVDDTILQFAIACEVTGKLFRIQPQELVFYRKHGIPLPRKHPDQRHLERLVLRK